MHASERVALLRESYLMENIAASDLERLGAAGTLRRFGAGETVFRQGELADVIHVIADGTAEEQVSADGDDVPVALLSFADVAGEECLRRADSSCYGTTVSAIDELVTLAVPLSALRIHVGGGTLLPVLEREAELLDRIMLIRRAAPFAGLSVAAVRELAAAVAQREILPGERLVVEGQPGDACFLVRSGEFAVHQEDTPQEVLAVLGPGSVVGEVSLLAGEPRRASVTASTAADVLVLERQPLLRALEAADPSDELQVRVNMRVRPRRDDNVEIHHGTAVDGAQHLVLKHKLRRSYFQLSEFGAFVWQQLDGSTPLTTIIARALARFGVFSPQGVVELVGRLLKAGFANLADGSAIRRETSAERGPSKLRLHFELLEGEEADRWASLLFDRLGLLTHPGATALLLMSGMAGLAAAVLAALQHGFAGNIGTWQLLLASFALAGAIALHEAAHMLAMKKNGLEVHGVGLGWSGFYPVAFVDTSDTWIASARARTAVALAGPIANVGTGGGAALVASTMPVGVWSQALWVCATLNYAVALLALNPNGAGDGAQALRTLLKLPSWASIWRTISGTAGNRLAALRCHGWKIVVLLSITALHLFMTAALFYILIAAVAARSLVSVFGVNATAIAAGVSLLGALALARGISASASRI
ncbi:MAG TPA: PqqD family peptide modification chaperone [Devosiaceae bacterium]|jgi:CRP-like cAMP-binding protein|nr:PqqD family peptide modification chaperone [Devosiaceae bacterium]